MKFENLACGFTCEWNVKNERNRKVAELTAAKVEIPKTKQPGGDVHFWLVSTESRQVAMLFNPSAFD